MKIAAFADLHVYNHYVNIYRDFFIKAAQTADVILICGDLTSSGLPQEAQKLADDLKDCSVPILAILGNHDYESGREEIVKKILKEVKVVFLEEHPFELNGVSFTGVKGFGGGFGNHILAAFGEPQIKAFVQEAINEATKLENQLLRLNTKKKVVLLHYSPVPGTCEGEAKEIYPLLGSSRLAEPIDTFDCTAAFHGHAHHGSPQSTTTKGIPVYNCAFPLRKRLKEDEPYVTIDI